MTKTPRTDAEASDATQWGQECPIMAVTADFARQLERENTRLRDAIAILMVPYNEAKASGLPSGVYVQRNRFENAEKALTPLP